jgi:hypothetical protein
MFDKLNGCYLRYAKQIIWESLSNPINNNGKIYSKNNNNNKPILTGDKRFLTVIIVIGIK